MLHARSTTTAGFTLTEMMVVVVIVGVLAAVALPTMSRERKAFEGKEFANDVARELQRSRMEATSTRMPMYAFFYSDRMEVRSANPSDAAVTPLSAPPACASSGTVPCDTHPIRRVLRAREGTIVMDVNNTAGTPSQGVNTTSAKAVTYSSMGAGFIPDCAGNPTVPCQPSVPATVYVYIQNQNVPTNHPERYYRIDVSGLTGYTDLRASW